jgi:hypothetical protein
MTNLIARSYRNVHAGASSCTCVRKLIRGERGTIRTAHSFGPSRPIAQLGADDQLR